MGVINLGNLIEKIKNKLSKSGYVTNTDYASSSTAGVLKISTTYGVNTASSGNLTASARTSEQYASAPGTLLIGKGTLENAKADIVASAIGMIADADGTATTGTTWTGLVLTKTANGYEITFTTVVPGE